MGTKMKINRFKGETANSNPTFVERKEQIFIEKGQVEYIPINIGFNKYDIRTIKVMNDKDSETVVTIFDKKEDGDQIYKSLQEKKIYDILTIPIEDKDNTAAAHVFVENKGDSAALFSLNIKAVSLS